MDTEIRLVDLFEAVLEHPDLYTLHGSDQEAVVYLEGCYHAFMHHRIDGGSETSAFALDLQRYQLFSDWLAERFGAAGHKEALKDVAAHIMSFREDTGISPFPLPHPFLGTRSARFI